MVSDDELPPLPNKEKLHTVLPDDYRYGHIYGYTADQMREYARAVERAAYAKAEAECEQIAARHWAAYKGRDGIRNPATHYNPHEEGISDGAGECADAIRALGRQHD